MTTSERVPYKRSFIARIGTILLLVLALSAGVTTEAWAHCDAMDGPVVTDARTALATGDLTPVLKWVWSEHEAEVRRAFEKALTVRTNGAEAQELADLYFFETVVRLHRESEGAPYTGLKPAGGDVPSSIEAADRAVETGSADDLTREITEDVKNGLAQRYERVLETKARADESVKAGRAYVKAYVVFIHYVERLHANATRSPSQSESANATAGH